MSVHLRKIAQQYFIDGDFKNAKELYSKLNMPLEVAYCEIYLGNLTKAKKIISKLKKNSPAEEWIVAFIQMIEADLKFYPSFLQIRNFFEIDLNNLFLSGQKEYIENVINYVPTLVNANGEVFKLTARVLKNNGQNELAKKFLKESLDLYYKDSETHFILGEIYLLEKNIELAKKHLQYALENGNYYPAQKLLQNCINETDFKNY